MAKKKQATAQPRTEIDNLITALMSQWRAGELCDTGQNRLMWFQANRHRFSTIADAIKGWTTKEKQQFFAYFGIYRLNKRDARAKFEVATSNLKRREKDVVEAQRRVTIAQHNLSRAGKPLGKDDIVTVLATIKHYDETGDWGLPVPEDQE